MMELYKYTGAGNDFLILDNRDGKANLSEKEIASICDRHYGIGADGLMLLETEAGYDFRMVYYNSDGSGGMMCGNGGRCIVAFAADLGILPTNKCNFIAADGVHTAEILSPADSCKTVRTIRLKMKDVNEITPVKDGYFLDTGTRHFVKFVTGLENYDVFTAGRTLRYDPAFAPVGTNVNFIEQTGGVLHVRTYEKGVEDETCACGTGIVASALAAYHHRRGQNAEPLACDTDRIHVDIKALHDDLGVDFVVKNDRFYDVHLTGPAAYIGRIILP